MGGCLSCDDDDGGYSHLSHASTPSYGAVAGGVGGRGRAANPSQGAVRRRSKKQCKFGDNCSKPRCTFTHSFSCATERCRRARRNGFTKRDTPWKTCCRACAESGAAQHDDSCFDTAIPRRVTTKKVITMFHGTSRAAWDGIQRDGFRRAGDDGSGLGRGVYLSYNINKTNFYRHSCDNNHNKYNCGCDGGVVIKCTVDIGRQFTLGDRNDPMRTAWQEHGYDSAFAGEGVIGKRPEFCIADPGRITIVGLECWGHDGWRVCVGCKDMIYSPKSKKSVRKFRCSRCR